MDLRTVIRDIPDFPKPGILFRDVTPVMEQPAALQAAVEGLAKLLDGADFDAYAAIESRGFLFGAPLALRHEKPLIMLRKAGKLPLEVRSASYALEYGEATLEMHVNALQAGQKVIIVDDLLATGGTADASAQLIADGGGVVAGFLFLVELADLGGRARLETTAPVFSLVSYD